MSTSWLVRQPGRPDAVLRIDGGRADRGGTMAEALGLDRSGEHRLLAELSRHGLAPAPLALSADGGVSLRCYVSGATWDEQPPSLQQAAAALARVHATVLPAAARPAPRHWPLTLARYAALAGPAGEPLLVDASLALHELAADPVLPPVLCHQDPLPANALGQPGRFLDWEYAALGDPRFDLAVLGAGLGLRGAGWERLARAYAAAGGVRVSAAALGRQATLARAVARLWGLAVAATQPAGPFHQPDHRAKKPAKTAASIMETRTRAREGEG